MPMFEVFDGDRYLFSVPPSENPRAVLQSERYNLRNPRLRMVMVADGVRTEVEGPGEFPSQQDREEESMYDFEDSDE